LPPEIDDNYNFIEAKQKCYGGFFCYDCLSPKFPGYPLKDLHNFTDFNTHMAIPQVARGRLRALRYNDEVWGFTYVHDLDEVIVQGANTVRVVHGPDHPAMRETFGRHFVVSEKTTSLNFYAIEKDQAPGTYKIDHKSFTSANMRRLPPQLGAEFYIWWPGPNYLLSRLYNVRNFEIIPFHKDTYGTFPGISGLKEELLLDHSHIPNFEVVGDIVFYPSFRKGVMYIPLALPNFNSATSSNIAYQVNLYSTEKVPWEITLKQIVSVPGRITSIASFKSGVVVSLGVPPLSSVDTPPVPFYDVDKKDYVKISYTGGPPTRCDLKEWKFMQTRPCPDYPKYTHPVYTFCDPYEIYRTTYDGTTLTIDTANKIVLDPDTELPVKGKARFNLGYPYDLNGHFLINFGVYKNSKETGYNYEFWNTLTLSYINLATRESNHLVMDIHKKLM